MRRRRKNWWNKWHTPQASQARAGGERGPRTEGKQPQTPGNRTGAVVAQQTQWQRAQEIGSAGTGHEGGAATRGREVQVSKLEHATGREDKRQDGLSSKCPGGGST